MITIETKASPVTEHADALEAIGRTFYPLLLGEAYEAAIGDYGFEIAFDVTNPRIKDVVDGLAKKIRDVAETTKEDVRRWIEIGTEEGLSPAEIARQITSKAADISKSRALTIARTESARAYSQGAIAAYGDAGITHAQALDSDNDAECAARNGKVYTLEEAASIEPHPNCQLAWSPVVE